jgi:diguanylate cyclase (GGDEF)-like protein
MEAYQICHAAALGFVYVYNFVALRRNAGIGARIFRFSLLALAVAFVEHAALVVYLYHGGSGPAWLHYVQHETFYDFALHCLLAFAAMAMWSESQIDRLHELSAEVDHVRRESAQHIDLDSLTGLLNQTALARRIEETAPFTGVVAVCDMDAFKDINDRYGHLAGDEILRNIGHLLQGSIRHEDEAFRWGGDEFVILFHNQLSEVARKRMAGIEARLRDFQLRGLGALPISFSWGTAEAADRPLREALDEADRAMYASKRAGTAASSRERPSTE